MNKTSKNGNARILVIDDNRSIHEDIRKILCGRGENNDSLAKAKALLFGDAYTPQERTTFEIDSAYQGEEGLNKVKEALAAGRPYAMAFVDIRMPPGWDGVETVSRIWMDDPDIQIVVCTAHSDYSWDEMIRKLGKSDSWTILKKPFDNIEVFQLSHALTGKWNLDRQLKAELVDMDQVVRQRTTELLSTNTRLKQQIAERKQVEDALRESEKRFSLAFQATPMPSALLKLISGSYIDVNAAFINLTGHSRERLLQPNALSSSLWVDTSAWATQLQELQKGQAVHECHSQIRDYDGRIHEVLFSAQPLQIGDQPCALTIMQDVTEQYRLECELRQSQKMEAIGKLAAGVAHDFNNLLTVILCCSASSLDQRVLDPELRDNLSQIRTASERAASLTRQLLIFSRKQVTQAKPLDAAATLLGLQRMLNRLIGEHIVLSWDCAPDLPQILADAGNFEQVVVNLVVNARDALTRGGEIKMQLREIKLTDNETRRHVNARPGQFVGLTVSDNGCGMDAEVLQHLFEPFFTTKPVGKGTGLGLSTVYAIVHQHGGWVEVSSELGKGSTFTLFFPAIPPPVQLEAHPAPKSQSVAQSEKGHERILLVEDDSVILTILSLVLKRSGYLLTSAKDGPSALEAWAAAKDPFDLLISDIVMPNGISGAQLADKLKNECPGLRTILMTGYSTELLEEDSVRLRANRILLKPFTHEDFTQAVREVLDAPVTG